MKTNMEIDEKDLIDLIFWARRYCDRRSTYVPSQFNQLYDKIVRFNPSFKDKDQVDTVLTDNGKFWPYAQDAMFNEKTGAYDARPKNEKKKRKLTVVMRKKN